MNDPYSNISVLKRPLNAQTVQQDKESRTAAKDEKILSDQDLFSWGVNLQNIL